MSTSNKIVVYTAIMGNFDNIKEPLVVTSNVDYICFTDNEKIKSKTWKIILLDKQENSRKLARKLKILGHEAVNHYDYSIWVDGNIQIKDDLTDLIEKYFLIKNIDLATFKHPVRNCIYEEAIECAKSQADSSASISKQVKYLIDNGYPTNNGLVESNVLFKNNKSSRAEDFFKRWWYFVDHVTIRDQLSFNYVLHELKHINFINIDGNSRGSSEHFEWSRHQNKSILYRLINKISSYILKRV